MGVKQIKKLGAAVLISSLMSVPCAAKSGDLTVSEVRGEILEGTASYSAKLTNHTDAAASPAMVLVWYENGMLKDIKTYTETVSAGGDVNMNTQISNVTVTDDTKITGFILENKKFSIPISYDEIERLGNNSVKIEDFQINGLDAAEINMDGERKKIDVLVPLYNKSGDTTEEVGTQQTVSVTVENAKSTVAIDGVALDGNDSEKTKTGTVDFADAKTLTVTAEDGTACDYALSLGRFIKEDFDNGSAFSDEMLIGSSEKSETWKSGTKNLAQGEAARYFSTVCTGNANEYAESISVGVLPISEAHKRDRISAMDTGSTNASGKAIRISKTRGQGNDATNATPYFQINNAYKGAQEYVTVEYDTAFDYGRVTEGMVGTRGGGIRYFGSDKYAIYDNSNKNTNELEQIWNLQLVENTATAWANGENGKPNCPPDSWYHVKTVLDVKNKTATTYIDGKQLGTAEFDVSEYWKGNILISFQTSGFRSVDIWVDNIKTVWR